MSIKWKKSREINKNVCRKVSLFLLSLKNRERIMKIWRNELTGYLKMYVVKCLFFHSKIYSPTKVKHHLTCFNNIFSNNELISNRFAVFVTCTHILTYLWNRLLIDFYLCVYDRVCKVPRVLFNICVCKRKLIFFV